MKTSDSIAPRSVRFIPDGEGRDFVFENDWDTCIPVSFEDAPDGSLVVTCFPELTQLLRPHFLRCADDPFSGAALQALWAMLAPFLAGWGYADDRFRDRWGYILRLTPEMPVCGFPDERIRPLDIADEDINRTTFDLASSAEAGLVAYGAQEEGKIVSVAITHTPPDEADVVEVGVETIPAARRKGLAAASLAALSAALLRQGHTVEYRCQRYNRASRKTAQRVGFSDCGRYYFYVCRKC